MRRLAGKLPIRWRLAGGSALLTLVILLGFAVVVGTLTTRRLEEDFDARVSASANELATDIGDTVVFDSDTKKYQLDTS